MTNPQGLFLKARAKHIIQADRGACFRITNGHAKNLFGSTPPESGGPIYVNAEYGQDEITRPSANRISGLVPPLR